MRFYLAGQYRRRAELLVYAAQLQALGHDVVARWLDGTAVHDPDGSLAASCEQAWHATGSYPADAAPFAWSDWHAESANYGEWDFVLFDVHCHCGWFLAKAEPVMGNSGINAVEGECKRHGHVTAETWNVIDAEELQ